ncbi:NAD(P)H-dependent oxidoreductase [uncultured Clostridium sp.]|uniref:NAD(P)H-dependent oxidoreductase n=1 Tax=uncultured Clostridium sp. TaxID=59620 RepID=UPI0026164398|nr:NAD(P)H-dependent oxidoreductase [uncultured Clostridium sp.]
MKKEEILEGLNFRHACKEFDKSKKIDEKDFEFILESGRLAPSSMGIEPWKFLVLQNEAMREEIANVCWGGKKQIPSASHVVIILNRKADELKHNSEYIDSLLRDTKKLPEDVQGMMKNIMKDIEDSRFKGNDELIDQYSREQCYLPLGTMMDVAALMKIDSCAIGGIDKEKVEKILVDNNVLDTKKFEVTIIAAFGYRVSEPGQKTRRDMSEVVEWVR